MLDTNGIVYWDCIKMRAGQSSLPNAIIRDTNGIVSWET